MKRYYFAATLAIIALTLAAYHALLTRSFAADDFQWLLGAQRFGLNETVRNAFDPGQNHFYRPVVWLSFWLQAKLFGLDPRGYHAASLGLHLANALLVGWLCYRLTNDGRRTEGETVGAYGVLPSGIRFLSFVVPTAIVALHPAPFEAVVWVSGQSDLIAACWLLLMVHCWRLAAHSRWPIPAGLLALLFLTLALLTKESAIIGLPLLLLLDLSNRRRTPVAHVVARYLLPTLLTLAYLALQLRVERQNYIVDQGGYGVGPQVLLNPLRSLGLLVAPLPGSEHADAFWLLAVGLAVALLLLWLLVQRRAVLAILALGLTLLPTAPFASPPDSRYLYAPLIAAAVLVSALVAANAHSYRERSVPTSPARAAHWLRAVGWALLPACVLALLAAAETSAREQRFATASGADGSLFRLAATRCATNSTDRVIVLNPPIAEIHARAILDLACGDGITPIFVDSMAIAEDNLEANSLIIDFPGGSAHIAVAR